MRNRRAAFAAIAGTASVALTMSACGGQSSTGSSKGGTIGIAMPTQASERWITDGKSVVKDLQANGYKTKLVYGENDPATQVSQIENLITQGVSALIIAAIDNKSLNKVLQQAADANIPVISYDRLILGTKNVTYYASFDNEQVGRLQARFIIDKLGLEHGKGPFNIELFAGSSDDNNTKYFFSGALHLLQPFLDSKQLVVRSGETALNQVTTLRWDGATAQKRMNNILATSYKTKTVDAVLSPYDGISIGVLAALRSNDYGSSASPSRSSRGRTPNWPRSSRSSRVSRRRPSTRTADCSPMSPRTWSTTCSTRGSLSSTTPGPMTTAPRSCPPTCCSPSASTRPTTTVFWSRAATTPTPSSSSRTAMACHAAQRTQDRPPLDAVADRTGAAPVASSRWRAGPIWERALSKTGESVAMMRPR